MNFLWFCKQKEKDCERASRKCSKKCCYKVLFRSLSQSLNQGVVNRLINALRNVRGLKEIGLSKNEEVRFIVSFQCQCQLVFLTHTYFCSHSSNNWTEANKLLRTFSKYIWQKEEVLMGSCLESACDRHLWYTFLNFCLYINWISSGLKRQESPEFFFRAETSKLGY